ncbi:MAG: Gfo/Idh/MocA family oxidoreductase [Pseudomonadales bacterium]
MSSAHIGLIGCGRWGKHILRDLKSLGCRVTVVARSDSSRSNALEYGADVVVEQIDQLKGDFDGFVVATPTAQHAEHIESILHFDKPVFCEKPLTNDLASAERLVGAAGDRIFVMDKWKYHGGVIAMADFIAKGSVGKINHIISRRNQWGNPHTDVDETWILTPHDISIAQLLLGHTPTPVSAVAETDSNGKIRYLRATLTSDSAAVLIEVSGLHPINERSLLIICEGGSVMLTDSFSEHLLVQRNTAPDFGSKPEKIPFKNSMPLLAELDRFVNFIEGGKPPVSSGQHGLENVACISQLRELSQTNG